MKRKKTVQQNKYETNRQYTFDRAMQEAAKRAASHPRMIGMTSNVPEKR